MFPIPGMGGGGGGTSSGKGATVRANLLDMLSISKIAQKSPVAKQEAVVKHVVKKRKGWLF